MQNKVGQKLADQLLESRKHALEQFKEGTIRPHGKLWGMDVFSWANPNPELVASTIESFPFPVKWIGEAKMFDAIATEFTEVWNTIDTVVAYDSPGLYMTAEHYKNIETVIGTLSVFDALTMFKGLTHSNGVLLFTASGVEWERLQNEFNDFLKLHQY